MKYSIDELKNISIDEFYIKGFGRGHYNIMEGLIDQLVDIAFDWSLDVEGSFGRYYYEKPKKICINSGLIREVSEDQNWSYKSLMLSVFIHELTHGLYKEHGNSNDKRKEEFMAHAVTHCVFHRMGDMETVCISEALEYSDSVSSEDDDLLNTLVDIISEAIFNI